ncbi:hypothetical protein HYALB_00010324 [Hymenoscyphus albidus]|uniref:Alpha/beta hydrolase fold-3 domain-containing protein n=1 Tax=Hymenoscyphus albidus TaxID=595503 RepID=A0A9N9LKZ6_9HELO|nr:hypothetical protein HYALB_00010324 [Hymenoscyphus albidus]
MAPTTIAEQQKLVKAICNKFISHPVTPWKPISQHQKDKSRDPPARGPIWISRTSFPAPPEEENDLCEALFRVCQQLKQPHQTVAAQSEAPLREIGLKFIGNRIGVASNAPEPDITELETLQALESESARHNTVSQHVALCGRPKLESLLFAIDCHPKISSPGALLDALVAYASLIYPPPGSSHTAVPANKIVLGGDSAGGSLCFSLVKVLLELNKQALKPLLFHGNQVSLPVPAGLAVCSAWADTCDIMPSWHKPDVLDIYGSVNPALVPGFPTDNIWPSTPPREHLYCAASTLDHELVTPAAVKDWTGAPPMRFTCGAFERNIDGNKAVAAQAAKCGVTVQWNEYEGMFHEFMVIASSFPQTKHCYDNWAKACADLADGKMEVPHAISFKIPNFKESDNLGRVTDLSPLPFDEMRRRMLVGNPEREVLTGRKPLKRHSKL